MSLDANPAGKGYALWLMPGEPTFSFLAGQICRLCQEFSTPRFEPHITLLSRIALAEEKALAKSAKLARILKPFAIELGEIGYLDDFFRCLFVSVVANPSISKARLAACRVFARQNEPYMPHLSLVYGNLPVETKRRVATGLRSLSGRHFRFRRLALYRVGGPVRQWKCVKTFDLT
ncbi:MAG TPA: 2'-5' RNA ligase family protein [Terriglobia bacterium]|nr:2'-5' RNA ligase family protein [Terriglobia bacterium]